MTKEKWMSATALALLLTAATSCEDWGRQDPPAGNQIFPSLENVANLDFEAEEGLDPAVFTAVANPGGNDPAIVNDNIKGNVLCLDNGYVSVSNPFNKVVLQNAASFTFWMMEPETDGTRADGEDQEPTEPTGMALNMDGSILTFGDNTGSQYLNIHADGALAFNSADGQWSETTPDSDIARYITQGDWHYVGIVIKDKGYEWWIDGECKSSREVTDFDFSKLVAFANNAPVMTIGAPDNSSRWYVDDLKIYRNTITEKETTRPALGGGGSTGPDLSTWVLLGQEDNSTGFWSTWSDYVNLTGDGTIHYEFYNYNGGEGGNWCNWALVLTNGIERGGDGYAEYIYMRADAWGWGNAWNGDNLKHDFDWDTFMSEMDGAYVTVDVTRNGTDVNVEAHVTAVDGTQRFQSITVEGVDATTLGSFLTCEGSHLLINPEEVFVGQIYPAGTNITGQTDCSTPWWSAHSPNNQFSENFDKWGVEFINHTTGAGANWNNWLLVCSNGPWVGEPGYGEYFVLRSDAFGWGASFDQGKTTMEQAFDWENYVADMKDAKVKILFSYSGGTLKMDCRQTTADGREMPRYKFSASDLTAPIGLFFTCELSWIEFLKVGYYPLMTVE